MSLLLFSMDFLGRFIASLDHWNKRQRKLNDQLRKENPETLATLGTQDTGQRQTKIKHNKKTTKKMSNPGENNVKLMTRNI